MILSFNYQLAVFLTAVATGIAMGFGYDIIRISRRIIKQPKIFIHISDALYWIVSAIAAFMVMLSLFNGEVRPFVIFATLLGMVIYFSLPSLFVMGIADSITAFLRSLLRRIFRPVKKICRIIVYPVKKLRNFLGKKAKKLLHLCKVYAKLKVRHFARNVKSLTKK